MPFTYRYINCNVINREELRLVIFNKNDQKLFFSFILK